MTPEMALHICILLAIVGVAMLAAMGGMAFLVVAVLLMVWPKMPRGDEVSVFPNIRKSDRLLAHLRCHRRRDPFRKEPQCFWMVRAWPAVRAQRSDRRRNSDDVEIDLSDTWW